MTTSLLAVQAKSTPTPRPLRGLAHSSFTAVLQELTTKKKSHEPSSSSPLLSGDRASRPSLQKKALLDFRKALDSKTGETLSPSQALAPPVSNRARRNPSAEAVAECGLADRDQMQLISDKKKETANQGGERGMRLGDRPVLTREQSAALDLWQVLAARRAAGQGRQHGDRILRARTAKPGPPTATSQTRPQTLMASDNLNAAQPPTEPKGVSGGKTAAAERSSLDVKQASSANAPVLPSSSQQENTADLPREPGALDLPTLAPSARRSVSDSPPPILASSQLNRIVEQIERAASMAAARPLRQIEIKINDAQLGTLLIHVRSQGSGVSVSLQAATHLAARLHASSGRLRRRLGLGSVIRVAALDEKRRHSRPLTTGKTA